MGYICKKIHLKILFGWLLENIQLFYWNIHNILLEKKMFFTGEYLHEYYIQFTGKNDVFYRTVYS
jgi:hypothetical protein